MLGNKKILFLSLVIILSSCHKKKEMLLSEKQQISSPVLAKAYASKTVVEPLEEFDLTFTVEHDKSVRVQLPPFEEGITGLRMLNEKEEEKTIEGRNIIRKTFRVVSDIEGAFKIPSYAIPYTSPLGRGVVETGEIYIQAGWPEDLTRGMRDIVDIKDIVPPPLNPLWIIIPAIAFVLASSGAGIFFYIRRRKKNLPPPPPPWTVALSKIEKLEGENLISKGKYREFYFSLSEIFRKFLEDVYNFPALEMTSEEIISRIHREKFFNDPVREFIELSDLPRYAGKKLEEEMCRKHLSLVREFILGVREEMEREEEI